MSSGWVKIMKAKPTEIAEPRSWELMNSRTTAGEPEWGPLNVGNSCVALSVYGAPGSGTRI